MTTANAVGGMRLEFGVQSASQAIIFILDLCFWVLLQKAKMSYLDRKLAKKWFLFECLKKFLKINEWINWIGVL